MKNKYGEPFMFDDDGNDIVIDKNIQMEIENLYLMKSKTIEEKKKALYACLYAVNNDEFLKVLKIINEESSATLHRKIMNIADMCTEESRLERDHISDFLKIQITNLNLQEEK